VTSRVGGATRVAGIIGDPVRHSRSPAIYNAAFAARGLEWVFVAFEVPAGQADAALAGARALGLAGLTVTMPHKSDAAEACDELTSTASVLGAVNLVVNRDGTLCGDSTDGPGLVAAVRDEGVELEDRRFLVLGAGGAARAICHALGAGGAHVVVAARRPDAADAAAALAPNGESHDFDALDRVVERVDVVVNATPLGMHGEPPPFDPDRLSPGQLVLDTVYHPDETPLLAAARSRGVRAVNGIGMLVHQAAIAFRALTGEDAPLEVMREAAERA
jgi:shikimate dehydrogenase